MCISEKQNERIRVAYINGNNEIKKALRTLFPEVVDNVKLKPGQIYTWGTDTDMRSGIVVKRQNGCFDFVNFITGETYLEDLPEDATNLEVITLYIHNRGYGKLRGPKKITSWCAK